MSLSIFASDWQFLLLGLFSVFAFDVGWALNPMNAGRPAVFSCFPLLCFVVVIVLCWSSCSCRGGGVGKWFVHSLWSQDLVLQACFLPLAYTCSIQNVLFTWRMAMYSIEGWALGRLVCSLLAQMKPTRQFCGVQDLSNSQEYCLSTGWHICTIGTVGLHESIWICLQGWVSWLHDQVYIISNDIDRPRCPKQ